jgi:glycerol uptake facilitator protein
MVADDLLPVLEMRVTATRTAARMTARSTLARRLVAETVGTAMLVLFGAGAVVAALTIDAGRLDYAAIGMIAAAFALVIAAVIFAFGTTSGAHINPAVTIASPPVGVFRHAKSGRTSAASWPAGSPERCSSWRSTAHTPQTSARAAPCLRPARPAARDRRRDVRNLPAGDSGVRAGDRPPRPGRMGGARHRPCGRLRDPGHGAGDGGSLNPARTFGPLLVTALWNGPAAWRDLPAYLIGPVLGGLMAAFLYDVIARPGAPDGVAVGREQGTAGEITGRRE